jgi:hypothetical protein
MAAAQKKSDDEVLTGLHKAIEDAFIPASLVKDKINENLPKEEQVDSRYVKDRLNELEVKGLVKTKKAGNTILYRFV